MHSSTFSKVIKPLSKKGETIYFLTDYTKANVNIPSTMPWDEIEFPQSYLLEKQQNHKSKVLISLGLLNMPLDWLKYPLTGPDSLHKILESQK